MPLTQEYARIEPAAKAEEFVESLLEKSPCFTGKLELNFKDGELKDINVTERHKCLGT